ncbi:transmembrane protein [Cystoisospora suis]|uniref:Transmembrane protein n=1 Tax=Cystoisospora suis TaxID=483139 RepID=A0A2C6KI72_9APIC|nr:transmembrane protein [Cystoisospora suis]
MPVCDSLSGPFCPHIPHQRMLRFGALQPHQCSLARGGQEQELEDEMEVFEDESEALEPELVPAFRTSLTGRAFEQNPDLFLAYVHRMPLLSSSSTAGSSVPATIPACRLATSSPALLSGTYGTPARPKNKATPVRGPGACVGVDWGVTHVSRDWSALYGHRTPRHHPEVPYQTRGLFLENALGDVSSSPAMSEALSSAIGQIGLGRSTLDDVWANAARSRHLSADDLPFPFYPSFLAGQKALEASAASPALFPPELLSSPSASTYKTSVDFLPSDLQRFVCFLRQGSTGVHDQSRCILAKELGSLPANLKASTEAVPRGWVSTSHLLTFDKSKAPFAYPFLERTYSRGLPLDAQARWTGLWEVAPVDQGEDPGAEEAESARGHETPRLWDDDALFLQQFVRQEVSTLAPAALPRVPARYYERGVGGLSELEAQQGRGGASFTLADRVSTAKPERTENGGANGITTLSAASFSDSRPSGQEAATSFLTASLTSLPPPVRRRPPVPFFTLAVLSSGEGSVRLGTSFVASGVWVKAVRNFSPSPRHSRSFLSRSVFVFSGLLEAKEVFYGYIPVSHLIAKTALWKGPKQTPELEFVNLLDFLPSTTTPWSRIDSLKFHYALLPPGANPNMTGGPTGAASGPFFPERHSGGGGGARVLPSSLQPLISETVSGLEYKVALGGLIVHVAQRSSSTRSVYYIEESSVEGQRLLGTLGLGESSEEHDAKQEARGAAVGREEPSVQDKWREIKKLAGDLLYGEPLASLFEPDPTNRGDSAESVQVHWESLGNADTGSDDAGHEVGFPYSHGLDFRRHGQRDNFIKEASTLIAGRRRQIRKALRDVTLEILRAELDAQAFKAVASSFTDAFVKSGNVRKLEPLNPVISSASLPPFAVQEEDGDDNDNGSMYVGVLRVLGDPSGEYIWHQAGHSAVAATAIADAERQSRERKRRGETAPVSGISSSGMLMPNSGTTWGSNRRLAMAKFDNLNNSVIDLRLPARSVGVYIQQVPVEAPLISFNDASDLKLVLWRRVSGEYRFRHRREIQKPLGLGSGLLKNMKGVMDQVLEALGNRPARREKDVTRPKPLVPASATTPSTGTGLRTPSKTAGPETSLKEAFQSILSLLADLKEKQRALPGETEEDWMIAFETEDVNGSFSSSSLSAAPGERGRSTSSVRPIAPAAENASSQGHLPAHTPSAPPGVGGHTPGATGVSTSVTGSASLRTPVYDPVLGEFSTASHSADGFRAASALSTVSAVQPDGRAGGGSSEGAGVEGGFPLSQSGAAQPLYPGSPMAQGRAAAGEAERQNALPGPNGGLGPRARMPERAAFVDIDAGPAGEGTDLPPDLTRLFSSFIARIKEKPEPGRRAAKAEFSNSKSKTGEDRSKDKRPPMAEPFSLGFMVGPDGRVMPLTLGEGGMLSGDRLAEQLPEFLRSMSGNTSFLDLAGNLAGQLQAQQAAGPLGAPVDLEQVLQSFTAGLQHNHRGTEDPSGGVSMPSFAQVAELLANQFSQARQFSASGAASSSLPSHGDTEDWRSSLTHSIESLREFAGRLSNATLFVSLDDKKAKAESQAHGEKSADSDADLPFGLPFGSFPAAGGSLNERVSPDQIGAAVLAAMTGMTSVVSPAPPPNNSTEARITMDQHKGVLGGEVVSALEQMKSYMGFDVVPPEMLGSHFERAGPSRNSAGQSSGGAGEGRRRPPPNLFAELLGVKNSEESELQPSKNTSAKQKKLPQQTPKGVSRRPKTGVLKEAQSEQTKFSEESGVLPTE